MGYASLALVSDTVRALKEGGVAPAEETVKDGNYTIVMVMHNMQQALRIFDRTAFLLWGEWAEVGNTGEIFSRPRDRRTEDYITGRFG